MDKSIADLVLNLKTAVGQLPERDQAVLTARFGLDSGKSMTLAEVGKRFGIKRTTIRQMEAKALRLLRAA